MAQPIPVVLSYVQVAPLLEARQKGLAQIEASPDLGLTKVLARIAPEGVIFPGGERLNWEDIEKIRKAESSCFLVENGTAHAIQVFSEETNRLCTLYPTGGAPSMLIGGFVMHRVKDVDPMQDTLKKVRAIAPLSGRVLDTATGLGYTAIEAAKSADEVVTIELDPGAQEIARLNPWSRALFENPKITQLMGDAFEVVPTFEDESFTRIIHDPPAFSLAGQLYSGEFYRQLYRVLKRGGRLFHYIGDLNSKSGGIVTKGALRRLQEAGFTRIARHPEAFGVVAYK
ncbi:MAG TPA: methyltransferase domain-containing protein [Ktedonobacteraceae bacterium]|nr:methyltransferase domain-containing protein [Ktedonobacteraceae bacterium]